MLEKILTWVCIVLFLIALVYGLFWLYQLDPAFYNSLFVPGHQTVYVR